MWRGKKSKGRPRKQATDPRMPCGQLAKADRGNGVTKEKIVMVEAQNIEFVASQPHRRPFGKMADAPLAGHAAGRLRLTRQIDQPQYRAAEIYGKRALDHMIVVTGSVPRVPGISAELSSRGVNLSEASPEAIAAIRSDYQEIQDAFADAGIMAEANKALSALTIMDRDPVDSQSIGNIRAALNVIVQRLRLRG